MKITIVTGFLFLIIFSSCKNDKKSTGKGEAIASKSIVGKWVLVDFELKGDGNKMTLEEKAVVMESSRLHVAYTADGKFDSVQGEDVEKGTYTYNEKIGGLVLLDEEGKETGRLKITWEAEFMIMEDLDAIMKMRRE